MPFRFDMETEALGVLANKANNYEPRMDLAFYDDGGMWIGDMVIKLNKWTYEIGNCGLTGNLFAAMDNWEIDVGLITHCSIWNTLRKYSFCKNQA